MDGQYAMTYQFGMLLMTLLFCGMLIVIGDKRNRIGKVIDMWPLGWIGEHSFEIYLWQYPVIFLFMYKKWDDFPGYALIEIIVILLLSAWLHWFTDALLNRNLLDRLFRMDNWERYSLTAASLAMSFFLVFGVVGFLTAADTKFAGRDDLQKRLEENKKILQAQYAADANGTGSLSADKGSVTPAPTQAPKQQTKQDYVYADPDLTNSAEVSKEHVLMIGDSIMLDASPDLLEELPGAYIDAVESRQIIDALDAVDSQVSDGHLNKTVVISLGTNGPVTEENARPLIEYFGKDISIFWVNLFGRTVTWEKESNQLLLDLSEEYSNLTIIDWRNLIIDHSEWLWPDAEHPNLEGSKIYAQLIRESLDVVIDKQNQG